MYVHIYFFLLKNRNKSGRLFCLQFGRRSLWRR